MPIGQLPAATPEQLENIPWMATSLESRDIPQSNITALFAGGTLSGSDGCNRYTTSYTIEGSALSISDTMAGTLMACSPEVMAVAQEYRSLLPRVTTFIVHAEGELIELTDASGMPLIGLRAESQSLSDTSWQVTGVNNGSQALVSVALGTTLTLDFSLDGQVSGNSGCNQYSGSYTQEGNNLSVSTLASTRMMCVEPEGVMDQEQQFQTALQQSAVFSLENNTLTIRDENGAMQVTATRN